MLAFGSLVSERAFQLVPAPYLAAAAALVLLGFLVVRALALGWSWLRDRAAGHVALEALADGRALLAAFALYVVFFVGAGGVFCALLAHVEPNWSWREAPRAMLAFSAAWLAGFVVPGAPGGLGVREAALTYLMADGTGEGAALLAALLMRVVTVLGDVLCFLACVAVERRAVSPSTKGSA